MKFACGSTRGERFFDALLAMFDHERATGPNGPEIRPIFSGKNNGTKGANGKAAGFAGGKAGKGNKASGKPYHEAPAPFHGNEKASVTIRGRVISKYKHLLVPVKVVQTFQEENAPKANTLDSVFKIDTKAWKMDDSGCSSRKQENRMLKLTESREWGC